MITEERGFTLVELLIAMLVFVLTLILVSDLFVGQLTLFKKQGKITESNTEGIIGLEILRRDIQNAGYGLPWIYPAGFACTGCREAVGAPASTYNDTVTTPPRAIVAGNDTSFNNSDYLVIKAINVATSATAQRWTRYILKSDGNLEAIPGLAGPLPEDTLVNTDNVIVLLLGGSDQSTRRTLVLNGTAWATTYNLISNFAPTDTISQHVIYGIDPTTALKMPFNRADYFISSTNVPARCAPNTGVLEKVVVNQGDGKLTIFMPLLDCVAHMQVVYGLHMDTATTDIGIDTYANAGSGGDAIVVYSSVSGVDATKVLATLNDPGLLRQNLKEVRIYILTHDGQKDPTFNFATNPFLVGEALAGYGTLGTSFSLSSVIGVGWQNYRWKVYTLVVKPLNLL